MSRISVSSVLIAISAAIGLSALDVAPIGPSKDNHRPQEWEHGFKTEHVKATRYANPDFGYNIGFEFPKIPYNCDDLRLFQFIESREGWPFEGGGFPGAPIYAKFKGVTDRESASETLKQILPDLSRLAESLQ